MSTGGKPASAVETVRQAACGTPGRWPCEYVRLQYRILARLPAARRPRGERRRRTCKPVRTDCGSGRALC